MANRKLQVHYKKIYKNGNVDTIYFVNRAKDVIVDENGNVRLDTVLERLNRVANGATKTSRSDSNGYIKINDTDTLVYEHPKTGVTAGKYNEVVVDDKGHVVSARYSNNWGGTVNGDISHAIVNSVGNFYETNPNNIHQIRNGWNIQAIVSTIAGVLKLVKPHAYQDYIYTGNLEPALQNKISGMVDGSKVQHFLQQPYDRDNRDSNRIASMYALDKVNKGVTDSWNLSNGNLSRIVNLENIIGRHDELIKRAGRNLRHNIMEYQIPLTSTFREIWTENGLEEGTYLVTCTITCVNQQTPRFYNFQLCRINEGSVFVNECDLSAPYNSCTRTIRTLNAFIYVSAGGRIFLRCNSGYDSNNPSSTGIVIESVWYQLCRVW